MSAAKPSLWQPLIKAALPGTAQSPPPGKLALPELEDMVAGLPAETPEARLLHQAAAIAVYDRAGGSRQRKGFEMPDPAGEERRSLCPAPLLDLWLDRLALSRSRFKQDWRQLQLEALQHFDRAGWRFPHRLLPELLEFGNSEGRSDADLRLAVLPLLGTRGQWLAGGPATEMAVRKPWNWILDLDSAQLPLHLGAASAALWLRGARRRDPRAALAQLQAAWPKADAGTRAQLLPQLRIGLQPDDEALLESALDDRRPDVRQQAQALLGQLPQSAFVARMQARALPLLGRKPKRGGGDELDLHLPVWPSDAKDAAAWQRDGLERSQFSSAAGRALVAETLLKLCPPAQWQATLGTDAAGLLRLLLEAPAYKSLASGLIGAILNFQDAAMAAACLREPELWRRNPPGKTFAPAIMQSMVTALGAPAREAAYLGLLTGLEAPFAEVPPETWTQWQESDAPLSTGFIPAWRKAIENRLRVPPEPGESLPAALLLPPFLILGAEPGQLPALLTFCEQRLLPWCEQHLPQRDQDDVEALTRLLAARQALHEGLSQSPSNNPSQQPVPSSPDSNLEARS